MQPSAQRGALGGPAHAASAALEAHTATRPQPTMRCISSCHLQAFVLIPNSDVAVFPPIARGNSNIMIDFALKAKLGPHEILKNLD